MITLELDGVNVGIAEKPEGGMALMFVDVQSGIRTLIAFDGSSWETFKRHVAADGKLPSVVIAPIVPSNGSEKTGGGV